MMTDNALHKSGSGDFGSDTATGYAKMPHGFDGRKVLDPLIVAELDTHARPGTIWADPGGGSAWLSIELARRGAKVLYSDRNSTFIGTARAAVEASGFGEQIEIVEADVCDLPYDDASVDAVLLSNVGCAVQSLGGMFASLARILKPGGRLIATAPASLDQVFTTDVNEDDAVAELEAQLERVTSLDELRALVAQQTKFHRATLRWKFDKASLVRDLHLSDGCDIWRLISGKSPLLVPNFWHGDRDYLWAIKHAGLVLGKGSVLEPTLDADQRTGFNCGKPIRETLGVRYEYDPAFRIYRAEKPLT